MLVAVVFVQRFDDLPLALRPFVYLVHLVEEERHVLADEARFKRLHETAACQLIIKVIVETILFFSELAGGFGASHDHTFRQRAKNRFEFVTLTCHSEQLAVLLEGHGPKLVVDVNCLAVDENEKRR